MNVSVEQLLQLIGEQQVELALLRRELARRDAETAPKGETPAAPGPRALEAR